MEQETRQETRQAFTEQLRELERQVLGGFDMASDQLDLAIRAVDDSDAGLAATVVAGDARIDRLYLDVHDQVIALLASQAPVAGDLRLVAALLHIVRCLERIGDQCADIARMVPLSGYESPRDDQVLRTIERMGRIAGLQIAQAKEAFLTRDVELAEDLAFQDAEVDRLNRDVFKRAVDIGDDVELREWATFMVLVARGLERVGDNTVGVAEQTVFLVTGELRELSDAPRFRVETDED